MGSSCPDLGLSPFSASVSGLASSLSFSERCDPPPQPEERQVRQYRPATGLLISPEVDGARAGKCQSGALGRGLWVEFPRAEEVRKARAGCREAAGWSWYGSEAVVGARPGAGQSLLRAGRAGVEGGLRDRWADRSRKVKGRAQGLGFGAPSEKGRS